MRFAGTRCCRRMSFLFGIRQDRWHENEVDASLTISSSLGVDDIGEPGLREISAKAVLDLVSADKVLRLPVCDEDEAALALVDSWPSSLRRLGLNISTGPVVPFRATELITKEGNVPGEPCTPPVDEPCAGHEGDMAAGRAQVRVL